jgi:membrane associated rhomboid family serine protease
MDETPSTTTPVCYRHPDRATRLSCSECGRPICVDCSYDAAVGQKCPECAKPEGRHQVVHAGRQIRRGTSFATSPVTMTLIAINAIVFAAGFLSPTLEVDLIREFAQYNVLIENGEWWRAITATFLHGGLWHIGFNMYALYLLGGRMEPSVGSLPFASMYAASALAGGIAWLLMASDTQDVIPVVGASGAIFGLFGAWLFNAYQQRHTPAGRAMLNQFAFLIIINMALPLVYPGIAWQAHLGGVIAGAVIAAAWSRMRTPGRTGILQRAGAGLVVALPLLATIVAVGL